MNKITLIGNLTRDPELAETNSGVAVAHFTVAVGRQYSNADGEKETDFFNCTAWRGLAENLSKYCAKGSKVAVVGSVQFRKYTDKQGVERIATDVLVNDVEFLGAKERSPEAKEEKKAPPKSKRQAMLEAFDDDETDMPF